MHEKFANTVASLVPSFEKLMEMSPIRGDRFPLTKPRKDKIAGVYLMSEGADHLYVGRSNDIASRFYAHRRNSSGDGVAPFAFRLACLSSGLSERSYIANHPHTRKSKMADESFRQHFRAAKERIKLMDFRYVEETDPVNQAILEVYCAVALGTPHNTFDNH
ncbi:hypothetical protein FHW02_003966 [Ochrobactrum sp. RH1CCR137]|nr:MULTISPECIES: hypothetical protein [unclassified Ochrobactrum]MBA8845879.1 hypothetical protein [Ochrobactrum sp. RH1CCR137]MBA8857601.1 hypothetical protein [Ochrobactrum sp. RH1CCR134]